MICYDIISQFVVINSIPPFDKEKFQGLLRGNFPMPLDSPTNNSKYSEFRKMLLGRIRSAPNYWMFVVTDHSNLSAEQIYRTRMNDKFWGLNERTPYRKSLKKGDKVIFSHGSKTFLGTASLDSDSFELDDQQKNNLSHNIDFYKSDYGVRLLNIVTWKDPKIVENFVNSISFITDPRQYPVYFQGGIKKISSTEYDTISKSDRSYDEAGTYKSIESASYVRPWEYARSWLSLNGQEIEEIVDNVIETEGKKLEIERSVIRRIISHLILSKHVILVGPPGTGKTDLARRLLSKLGNKLLGKSEPVESVASYEWGRFEVIGGISIAPESKEDPFHLGCVTHAIKEGKLLLIDEFNRADMNKAFGEMFLALDHGVIQLKEDENPNGFLLKSPNEIEIPAYFRMICTMNDYDKSLLNELSYGLLRRFAFVEINVPKEKKKIIDIVTQRARLDLKDLDPKLLDNSASKIEIQVDKFVEFLISISEKRQIGISSYIDVIRYTLYETSIANANPWKILNDALIDYVLPQFDRLDFDTLDFAHKSALEVFKDEKGTLAELQPFFNTLNNKVKTMQNLNKLFTTEESSL